MPPIAASRDRFNVSLRLALSSTSPIHQTKPIDGPRSGLVQSIFSSPARLRTTFPPGLYLLSPCRQAKNALHNAANIFTQSYVTRRELDGGLSAADTRSSRRK